MPLALFDTFVLPNFPLTRKDIPMSDSPKSVTTIDDLKAGVIVEIVGPFSDRPYVARSLGNYGPGVKVYLTDLESPETPESMTEKFKNNKLPDCFVCWDHDINLKYKISLVNRTLSSPA